MRSVHVKFSLLYFYKIIHKKSQRWISFKMNEKAGFKGGICRALTHMMAVPSLLFIIIITIIIITNKSSTSATVTTTTATI